MILWNLSSPRLRHNDMQEAEQRLGSVWSVGSSHLRDRHGPSKKSDAVIVRV